MMTLLPSLTVTHILSKPTSKAFSHRFILTVSLGLFMGKDLSGSHRTSIIANWSATGLISYFRTLMTDAQTEFQSAQLFPIWSQKLLPLVLTDCFPKNWPKRRLIVRLSASKTIIEFSQNLNLTPNLQSKCYKRRLKNTI